MHGGSYTESKIRAIRIIRSGWLNVYHHGTSSCQIRHGRDEMRGKGMSRVLRKQLFSIEELLEKANKVLEKKLFAPNVDSDSIIELIADCQNSAISMGEQIEKLYGEGTNCVALLEQYCEDLYQLTQSFDNSNKKREIYNSLNKQLKKLRGLMTSELPDRLEVVFFPYKASMWDSLESVYLAAREDENCDAYCVPIPYFDRNADGSLGQMHYEGNEYPNNIEVTDWQTYNLEERRPDVIYIHNPYDEWNLVTCVHPNYFAKNLKQYTDKLVYIPYFVLDEIEPDDQIAIDGMKHFVWTPGVIYADRVILQSDKMKQIYVNEFIKAAKESGFSGDFVNRRKLEEKFLGTGSPKFDKVKNTRKEDLEIPEEWLKIIQKPDGSWKKIIFYNTSIGALLENSEKMIEKIKDVLKTLYENRDEIALLWRPHPLIETTLTAMRPSLWESYKKIRDEYITGGWGIYDDSPDMDRAVILSDAYYGDQSSVVQLYLKTGKRTLIQNCEYKNNFCKTVLVQDAILYDQKVYFIIAETTAIFCMSVHDSKIEYIKLFAEQSIFAAFRSMERIGNKMVLIPFDVNYIVIVNMDSWETEKIVLPEKIARQGEKNYLASWADERYIYMFGVFRPYIIKFDVQTKTVSDVIDLSNEREIQEKKAGEVYFGKQIVNMDGILYMPFYNRPWILKLNPQTMQYQIVKIYEGDYGFSGACKNQDEIWLLPRNAEGITVWNAKDGSIRKIIGDRDGKDGSYAGIEKLGNKYTVFQMRESDLCYCNSEEIEEKQGEYEFVKRYGDCIIYYDNAQGCLHIVKGRKTQRIPIHILRNMYEPAIVFNKGVMGENSNFDLLDMLYRLVEQEGEVN